MIPRQLPGDGQVRDQGRPYPERLLPGTWGEPSSGALLAWEKHLIRAGVQAPVFWALVVVQIVGCLEPRLLGVGSGTATACGETLAAAQSSGEDRDRRVKARDDLAKRMTADQLADAQRRAREWTPTPEP